MKIILPKKKRTKNTAFFIIYCRYPKTNAVIHYRLKANLTSQSYLVTQTTFFHSLQ